MPMIWGFMRKAFLILVLGASALAATALADPSPPRPVDETLQTCSERCDAIQSTVLRSLQIQLTTLQAQLNKSLGAQSVCSADSTATNNGLGTAPRACGAYTCNPIDGKCRVFARDQQDCQAGYILTGDGTCTRGPQ